MTDNNCGNCKFFLPTEDPSGLCRRFPATPVVHGFPPMQQVVATFPPMTAEGWCGEWKKGAPK